jgi:hypothetical protein
LGRDAVDTNRTIRALQELEEARHAFFANKNKVVDENMGRGSKLDSFDPEAVHDLLDEKPSCSEESDDEDLDA